MAKYTTPGNLGSSCPDFNLPGTDNNAHSLANYSNGKGLLVMFICNHCPYVIAVQDRILALARELLPMGLNIVAISSNDAVNYPADSFEKMKERAREKQFPFPYLYDESQKVAKAFDAVCTPDFFLYDKNLKLVYRGRLDDSWKAPEQVTRQELRGAALKVINGESVPDQQYPSMGCSIKWKF